MPIEEPIEVTEETGTNTTNTAAGTYYYEVVSEDNPEVSSQLELIISKPSVPVPPVSIVE